MNTPHVARNTGNNEWYTPKNIVEMARLTLGNIDLDVSSSEVANRTVKADKYYTIEDDALVQDWYGRVWMNPPYSRNKLSKFIDKLVSSVESGDVTHAIVLVNNATETRWFRNLCSISDKVCFPSKRIKFLRSNGTIGSPLQGQAIISINCGSEFARQFASLGDVWSK